MNYIITYNNDGGEEFTDAVNVKYSEQYIDFTDVNKGLIKRVYTNNLRELKLLNYTPTVDDGTKLIIHTVNDREVVVNAFKQIDDYTHLAVYNQDGKLAYACNSKYVNSFTIAK